MNTRTIWLRRCAITIIALALLMSSTPTLASNSGNYHLMLTDSGEARSRHHEFDHQLRYPTRQYRDPMGASWNSAKMGALIGLGSGAAIALIDFSFGGDVKYAGRLMAGLTGLGFLTGGAYGYGSALRNNIAIERREQQMLQQFGNNERLTVRPIFTAVNDRLGSGLSATLRF